MLYVVFGLAFVLSYLAERRKKKTYTILLILILGCFIGFRARTVGIDTDMYYSIFQNLKKGIFSTNVEKEFLMICYLLLRVMKIEHVFLLFALLTNWLIIMRLWSLRNKESFSFMVMLYVLLLFPETANIMRQYLAIAIVFYATIFTEKRKPLTFFFLIAIALTIHRSAILGFSYYPVYYWMNNKNLNKKVAFCLLLMVIAPVIIAVFLNRFSGNMNLYLSGKMGIGLLYPVEALILFGFTILQYRNFRYYKYSDGIIYLRFLVVIYFLGIILCAMGYYQSSLYRLGLYFIIYEVVFIPDACTHGKNRKCFLLLYTGLIVFLITQNYLAGWSGLSNYTSWLV